MLAQRYKYGMFRKKRKHMSKLRIIYVLVEISLDTKENAWLSIQKIVQKSHARKFSFVLVLIRRSAESLATFENPGK